MMNPVTFAGLPATRIPGAVQEMTPPSLDSIREPAGMPGEGSGVTFGQALADAIGRVEAYRVNSEQSVQSFLAGEEQDFHRVAMAAQQAEVSLELFLQVKNKVVQAYQEIMRMQV